LVRPCSGQLPLPQSDAPPRRLRSHMVPPLRLPTTGDAAWLAPARASFPAPQNHAPLPGGSDRTWSRPCASRPPGMRLGLAVPGAAPPEVPTACSPQGGAFGLTGCRRQGREGATSHNTALPAPVASLPSPNRSSVPALASRVWGRSCGVGVWWCIFAGKVRASPLYAGRTGSATRGR
jgi:hypothetical protein